MSSSNIEEATEIEREELEKFQSFYAEIKATEKEDSTLTSKIQIDRLNRPGSSYFNLNPFDVLIIDPSKPFPDVKKKYKMLSLLVHPDKNGDDAERAQKAFEAVKKSYAKLSNPDDLKNCMEIVKEAKIRVERMMEEKRKKLKRGEDNWIPEDDPEKYRHAVYVQTCTLFADLERLRVDDEHKKIAERKRQAEEEEAARMQIQYEREWEKNYEETRITRVDSWKNFKAKKAKKGKPIVGFKPPKIKAERRDP